MKPNILSYKSTTDCRIFIFISLRELFGLHDTSFFLVGLKGSCTELDERSWPLQNARDLVYGCMYYCNVRIRLASCKTTYIIPREKRLTDDACTHANNEETIILL